MKKIFLTSFIVLGFMFAGAKGPAVTANVSLSQNRAPLAFMENKGQVTDQHRQPRTDIQFSIAAAPGLNIFIGNGAIHYQFSRPDSAATKPSRSSAKPNAKPDLKGLDPATCTMYRMDVELIGANTNTELVTEQKQDYYENYFNENTGDKGATAHTYKRITYKNIYPHIDWVLYMKDGQLEHEFVIHEGGNARDIQLKYGGATDLKINADGSLTATTPQGAITEQAPKSYQPDGTPVKSGFKLKGDVLAYETGGYKGEFVIDPTLKWATYFGDEYRVYSYSTATDNTGNVYFGGYTTSTSGIATSGAYQTTWISSTDAFLAKFNSAGNIIWATYYYGTIAAVATDNAGNVYVTGFANAVSGISTPGAYQTVTGNNGNTAFLSKFNSAGSLQWATYYGGNSEALGYNVTADAFGNIYITGVTYSGSGLATAGAYQTVAGDSVNGDAFLAKFTNSGALQWATYFGGNNSTNDNHGPALVGIATDASGNVFIAGHTTSTTGIATPGAYQTTNNEPTTGYQCGYLAKFTSAGSILWATYYGGTNGDEACGVATDISGNAYLVGYTQSSSGIASPNAYKTTFGGNDDAFLAKFSPAGSRLWATYFGGTSADWGVGVVTDAAKNVYILGTTESSTGISSAGAYQPTFGGGAGTQGLPYFGGDAFLAEFDSTGSDLLYSTYFGGPLDDDGIGIANDGLGNIYITGTTTSNSNIATSGAYKTVSNNYDNAYLAKFNFCTPPVAGAITGPISICGTGTITLADTSLSGVWSSSNTGISTINSSGVVSGVAAGTDTITYSVTNTCATSSANYPVTVNAAPTINTVSNQTVCAGDTTTTVNFTGTGTIYNWTCNNTSIGLAASGTGNIGSFTGVNTGSTPVTATVTVTPVVPMGYAYIAGGTSNTVSVINTATNLIVDTIATQNFPFGVSASPDGSKVYVTNLHSNSVSVINTATNLVTATVNIGSNTYPGGIAVSPDGSKAYVACVNSNNVAVVNTATNLVTANISVTGGNPYGIAVSPDGSKVYVAVFGSTTVSVINTATNTVTANITVGSNPYGVTVSPDGSKVYVTYQNSSSNSVSVINTATNTVTATISLGSHTNCTGVIVSPDGSKLYVASLGNSAVYVINTASNSPIDSVSVGVAPYGISISSDGSTVYVSNSSAGTVSVINTASNSVIHTTIVGGQPISMGNFVTGGTGCPGTPITFTITVKPTPTAGITGTATACGSVNLTATGGTGYAWSGGSSTNTAANTFSSSGTYMVTVSNSYSCSATAQQGVTVNALPAATITPGGATTFCQGGSVTLTASSGTSYLWSTTATTSSINVTASGNYTVTVTNGSNCSASSTITAVTVNALPTINALSNQTVCAGDTASTINFNGTGTVYTWVSSNPDMGLAASGAGNIGSFTAINTGNAPIVDTVTVTPEGPPANGYAYICNAAFNSVSVINTATNTVIDTIAVGNGPEGVSVSPDGSKVYIANDIDSTISVINTSTNLVTDTIHVGLHPLGIVVSPDGSKIYVANVGSHTVSVINGVSKVVAATISVTGSFGLAISPDGSKLYVTDGNANTVSVISTASNTVTATITGFSFPQGIIVTPDGSKVYVANENTNKVYVISSSSNTITDSINVVSNASAITISPDGSKVYVADYGYNLVAVINTATNTLITTIVVGTNPTGISITPDGTNVYVTNDLTGIVSVISTSTNTIIDSIPVNPYTVSFGNFITANTGCIGTPAKFTITVNPQPTAGITGTATACGSVSLTATGGGTGYVWSGGSSTNTAANTFTGSGTYTVTVSNSYGCSATAQQVVTVNPLPAATITAGSATIFCQGGSVTLTASTGSSYLWSTTATTSSINATTGGNYTVTVTNANNCSASSTVTAVTVNALPTPGITPPSVTFCAGGNATLTASGGVNYSWSNTANTAGTPVAPDTTTTYTVTVTDGNNCSATASRVVTVNPLPVAAINGPANICSGLQATLTASGGATYSWNNGLGNNAQITVQPTSNTTYVVTVSTADNCTATASQTVSVTTTPSASITGPTQLCLGDSITLTANGGNSYQWANGFGTNPFIKVSPTSLTTYSVTATIGANCSATASASVTVNQLPTASYTTSTGRTNFCQGDSLTLTAGAETGYLWSTGATTQSITVTQGGNEGVTVTDNNGCTASTSENISAFSVPASGIVQGDTSFCQGNSVTLTSVSQFQYLWSTGATTQNIVVNQAGSYFVIATNPVGCSDSSARVRVTANALPDAAINGPSAICSGLQATLTASGGTGYSWNNGLGTNAQVNVQPVNTTTYIVTVTDAHSCSATAQQTVSVTSTPVATIAGATEDCSGNNITLTANGGNTYTWANSLGSNAAITVSPTNTTTYSVTASIGANCSATASQTITVYQPASSQFSQSICAGQTYPFNNQNLNHSGAYYDTLQTIHTCDSIVTLNLTVNNAVQTAISDTTCKGIAYMFNGHSLNQSGIYKDTLQAASTCDSIVTLNLVIDSPATPTINRTGDSLQTQIFAGYQWLLNGTTISGTTQNIVVVQDGNYSVVVTNAQGCSDTSAVLGVTGLGIKDIAAGYGVRLYPNPNNGNFTLEFTDDVVRNAEITDAVGRTVVADTKVSGQQNFNLNELSAGIYFLRINNGDGCQSLKFSVVK